MKTMLLTTVLIFSFPHFMHGAMGPSATEIRMNAIAFTLQERAYEPDRIGYKGQSLVALLHNFKIDNEWTYERKDIMGWFLDGIEMYGDEEVKKVVFPKKTLLLLLHAGYNQSSLTFKKMVNDHPLKEQILETIAVFRKEHGERRAQEIEKMVKAHSLVPTGPSLPAAAARAATHQMIAAVQAGSSSSDSSLLPPPPPYAE